MQTKHRLNTRSRFGPLRKGDVRADGKIFWSYNRGQEYWLTPAAFEAKQNSQTQRLKAYRRKNAESLRLRAAQWRAEHPDRCRAQERESCRRRASADHAKALRTGLERLCVQLASPKVARSEKGGRHLAVKLKAAERRALARFLAVARHSTETYLTFP